MQETEAKISNSPPLLCLNIRYDLHDSRRDVNTETEGGVLIAITGFDPILPSGDASRHRSGGDSIPHYYYAHSEGENPLTYQTASLLLTRGVPRRELGMAIIAKITDFRLFRYGLTWLL
ncbi:hypothetical protein AVEN_173452-1 [Araneus ventricosus]|nr:hypothetical protein AVEN_173452-1 [Araneus ventricosus]